MAGIYIHIPFCKQACHYCNFHFSTSLRQKDQMMTAIHKELRLRKDYLEGKTVETVYFGGGTPSLLSAGEIMEIFEQVNKHYRLSENPEVTLETNPDDLNKNYLKELRKTPVNRFSIGIQSFFDEDLKYMNRAHNAQHAKNCIRDAQEAGFSNLSADLIYGTPTTTHERWLENLKTAFSFDVPHLSCYALTVEPKTALEHMIKNGKSPAVEENHSAEQFEILLQQTAENGYEQYEISNFCQPPAYAVHNTNYWKGKHYLGAGPSAHSFNGHSRQWNVAHNPQYMKAIKEESCFWEQEELTSANQYNEYIMTSLRTKWGVDSATLSAKYSEQALNFEKIAEKYRKEGLMEKNEEAYILSAKGKLLADAIMADFFVD